MLTPNIFAMLAAGRRGLPQLAGTVVAATLVCLLAVAPAAASVQGRARRLAAEVGDSWPGLQRADGSFHDYLLDRPDAGRYADSTIGLGLLKLGLRTRDRRLVRSGLAGLNDVIRGQQVRRLYPSPFEDYAVAAAYNLARRRLARDPLFTAHRRDWKRWLRGVRGIRRLGFGNALFNKQTVGAAGWLELCRSGLRSTDGRSLLAQHGGTCAQAKKFVNVIAPRLARQTQRPLAVVHDPPNHPLAYHAMALGFYARCVEMLGRRASPGARALLGNLARTSAALTGPDGDLAYFGRSQEEAWALTMTAYGAEVAASVSPHRWSVASADALATRALGRLELMYPRTQRGLLIAPALTEPDGGRGLDRYIAAGPYNGLTLMSLEWIVDERTREARGGERLLDRPGVQLIDAGRSDLAVSSHGPVWFAVRQSRTGKDLRLDYGLVAAKLRSDAGWGDLLRPRPLERDPVDTAGPVLLRGAERQYPIGTGLRRLNGAAVGVPTRFGSSGAASMVVFRPIACGVQIAWHGQPGELFEYSVFFRADGNAYQLDPDTVLGGGTSVQLSAPAEVSFEPGYASATDARLVRARMRFATPDSGRASIDLCGSWAAAA